MLQINKDAKVSVEDQGKVARLLRKLESKQSKTLTSSPKDLIYAAALIEHCEKLKETGGHLQKLFQPGPLSIEEYTHHKAFFDATKTYKEVLFRAANRCLIEGTLVATPNGPVPIESLQVGDFVLDRDARPVQVLNVWDNGEQDVVALTNRGKVYAVCTPEHEWLTKEFRQKDTLEQLRPCASLRKAVKVARVNSCQPLGKKNEPHAYVIGAMLGDGCCRQRGSQLYISSGDALVPSRVASLLNAEVKKNHVSNFTWTIYAKTFAHYEEWMKGLYAHEKIVNLEVIRSWDRESLLSFVAGLVDTDGSLSNGPDGHSLLLTSQSESIIDAFRYAVLALWNESPSIGIDSRPKYVNGPCYRATVRNPHALARICTELRPSLCHKYKAQLDSDHFGGKRSSANWIALTAKPAGKARVWDITVDNDDHLYLLANGLVTHNCGKSVAGAFTTTCWATGLYPDWWKGRVFDKQTKGWVCGDTNDTVRTILQEKLLGSPHGTGLLPAKSLLDVVIRPNTGGTVDTIYVKNENGKTSRIKMKTYQSGAESFYGDDPDYGWMDEEPSGKDAQLIWNQMYMRLLTTNGSLIITFTPLLGWTPLVRSFSETAVDMTPHD